MSRERTILDPTWNRNEAPARFFGSAVRSRENTSRAVEARRAGCETVSVTDSLRPPDRLARRTSSQNDLSVVHTEKKRRRLCAHRCLNAGTALTSLVREKKAEIPRLKFDLLSLGVSYRFIPCRSPRDISIA